MEKIRQRAGLIVRIAISAAILFYLAFKMDWPKLGDIAATADPLWLLAAFLCFAPMFALTAWRWQILLRVQEIRVMWWRALQLCLVGQFFNFLLPGMTGGDVAKIYYVTRAAPEKKEAAGLSVIVDRLFGLIVLLVIASVMCLAQFRFLTARTDTAMAMYLTLAIAAGTFVFGLASFRIVAIRAYLQKWGWWERLPLHPLLDGLVTAYDRYGRAWGANFSAFGISVVNHSFGFLTAYCIVLSLHLTVPFWQFVSILPILSLLIALPVSVGGLGVREALSVVLFSLMGLDKEHAVTFSLLYYAGNLAWSLIGSIFYLRYKAPTVDMPITESMTPGPVRGVEEK